MTSATGKRPDNKSGFTLLEVLIASTILLIGFSLVAIQMNRHLTVLQILEGSVSAYRLADKQLAAAAQRQQLGLPVPGQGVEEGLSWSVREEELKPPYEALNAVFAEVPWSFRGTGRLQQLTTEFEKKNQTVSP